MPICTCPLGSALPAVPNASCPSDFGQIQKIVFQRIYSSGSTKNKFTSAAAITALSSWTTLFSSTTGTKTVITPFVESPTSDGGDAITFGGGNDTLNGMSKIVGSNPVTMTFAIRQSSQDVIKALKSLMCELNLGVYLISGEGQIMAIKGTTEGDYYPIPINNLFVGDLKLNGLETPDDNSLSFSFLSHWSDNVSIVTPAFDPLTALSNYTPAPYTRWSDLHYGYDSEEGEVKLISSTSFINAADLTPSGLNVDDIETIDLEVSDQDLTHDENTPCEWEVSEGRVIFTEPVGISVEDWGVGFVNVDLRIEDADGDSIYTTLVRINIE